MEHTSHQHSFPERPCTLSFHGRFPDGSYPDPNSNLSSKEANELLLFCIDLSNYLNEVNVWASNESAFLRDQQALVLRAYHSALCRFVCAHTNDINEGVTLPAGNFYLTEFSPQLLVEDAEVALKWCQKHCINAIDVTVTLSGDFDSLLNGLVSHNLPLSAIPEEALTRTVNAERLHNAWLRKDINEIPPGCAFRIKQRIVCVREHTPKDKVRGELDD